MNAMNERILSDDGRLKAISVPRFLIVAVAGILCLVILGSSIYAFTTLSRLRIQYLSNRGHEIASALEMQARGSGKRNNPAFWQSLFEQQYDAYAASVVYMALADHGGAILAAAGDHLPALMEGTGDSGSRIFLFREKLDRPRKIQAETHPEASGWELVIGLDPAPSDFIRRLAFLQLAVSGCAVMMILGLALYLMHTLTRYVKLKERESAETQLRSLGVMAASLAHEIRNPLGAMKGLTQLAQEDLPPDHAVQPRLRTVVGEAERLERLVNDLLDFARPRERQLCRFDLIHLLADITSMLHSRIAASNVRIDVSAGAQSLYIRSDQGGIRQVLLNVILNAVDVSPEDGTITVAITSGPGPDSAVLTVIDSGPGLGARDPEELMQPFITTKFRGTGLGLAVSARIMEDLGGSIALEDNPGGGARCVIKIPAV